MKKQIKQSVPIIAGILILVALSLPLWADGWVKEKQASVQASAVLVLVIVTAYYAWQAQQQAEASVKMAEEMERQRQESLVPDLTLWSIPHAVGTKGVSVNIQNCGRGPARNIRVECWWRKDQETFYFLFDGPSSLNPGDTRLFDCRPIPYRLHPSPAGAAADFIVSTTWWGFNGVQYGPEIDTTMNEQMRAFGTKFVDHELHFA